MVKGRGMAVMICKTKAERLAPSKGRRREQIS